MAEITGLERHEVPAALLSEPRVAKIAFDPANLSLTVDFADRPPLYMACRSKTENAGGNVGIAKRKLTFWAVDRVPRYLRG